MTGLFAFEQATGPQALSDGHGAASASADDLVVPPSQPRGHESQEDSDDTRPLGELRRQDCKDIEESLLAAEFEQEMASIPSGAAGPTVDAEQDCNSGGV